MKFKEFFKNLFTNIKDGISRFLIAFICSILLFLITAYGIIFETNYSELLLQLCLSFVMTSVFSALLKLAQEYLCDKINRIIQFTASGIVVVSSFILLRLNFDSLYTAMAYVGIVIALICFIFFVIMRGENRDSVFQKIVASNYFIGAICYILSLCHRNRKVS